MGNKAKKITVGILATILLIGAVCAGLYTLDVFKSPEETVVLKPASDDAVEQAKNVTDETTLRELLSQNCELDIQVTENIEITETLTVNGVKKVTGDVTLKAGYELGGGVTMLDVSKGATLTINGWNMDGNGIAAGIHVSRNATLNHVAGNMEYMGTYGVTSEGIANLSDKTNIAHVGEGAVKVSIEGTANITGGTYKDAGKYMVNVERGAALNVSGEPLFDTAVEQLVYNYGETKITGGTFLNSGYRGISNYAKMTMEYQGDKEDGHIEVGNTGNVAVYSSSSFKVSFKGIYGHDAGANVFLQSNTQSVCKVEDCLFDNGVGNAVSLRGNVTFTDVEVKNATASGILVQQNGVAKLKNVKVSDVQGRGITVESATLTGENIDIQNTGGVGFGAQVIENVGPASVDVSNVHLQDVKGNSIKVSNGATMTFKDSTFEKSKRTSVYVDNGKITLKGVQVLGNLDTDVQAVQVQPDGEFVISGNTVITGGTMRAVAVYGGKFTMNGGTIKDNHASETGAAVHITKVKDSVGTFVMNGGSICDNETENNQKNAGGVNVSNDAVFTMNGGKIYGNSTSGIGGGVRVAENAVFNLNGGSIYGNTAKGGGGVRIDKNAKVTMTGGSIYQNISTASGGGVHILGEFVMSGGKIYQNTAASYGGAMNIASETNNKTKEVTAAGSFIMTGGEIYGNHAVSGGGAIQVSANTTAHLSGGTVKNNDTAGDGDGIRATGKVTISQDFYLGNDKAVLTNKDVTVKVTGNKLTKHSAKDPLLVAVADGVATGHVVVKCDSKKAAGSLVSQTASGNGSYLLRQKDENLVVDYAAADMDMTGADKVFVSNFKELKAAITGTQSKRYVVLSDDIEMESSITVPNGTTVYIRDDGVTRTLSRKDGTSATFFNTRYGTGLYLAGTEQGKLVIDGTISEDVDASKVKSMVTAKGGTSISNVIFQNNGLEESTSLTGIFVYQTYGYIDMKDSIFRGAKGNSGAVGIASLATGYAEGCSYTDNSVSKGGGAIRLEKNAEFTALKCVFEQNSAGTSGGAVVSESATFVAYDCDFKNNQAKNDGGVLKSNGGTAKFLDSDETKNIMENNTCGANGGAVWAKGTLTVQTYLLKENKSGTGHGGGIFLEGKDTLASVTDSEFRANESLKNCGGAISNGGVNLTIDKTNFVENKTTANNKNGGAVYSNNVNSLTTITDSVFEGNQAKTGGAIMITAGEIQAEACDFVKNVCVGDDGGAINMNSTGGKVTVTLTGNEEQTSKFEGNIARWNGGAIRVCGDNESVLKVTGYTFKDNKVGELSNDNVTLAGTSGAVSVSGKGKITEDSTGNIFEGNEAKNGGAVYYQSSEELYVSDWTFKQNYASENGGALYIKTGKVTLNGNVTFSENTAVGYGGALFTTTKENVVIIDTIFDKNKAVGQNDNLPGKGGAIYLDKTSAQGVTITRNIFSENRAAADGGAVFHNDGKITVTDCDFTNNSAATSYSVSPKPDGFKQAAGNGGAVYIRGTASALITATEAGIHKFTGNTAYRGGNGYIWGAIANNSTGDVRYSAKYVFENNTHENQGEKGIGCGVQDSNKVLIRMDEADSYATLVTAVKNAGTKQTAEITIPGDIVIGTARIDVNSGQKIVITNDKSKDVVISRTSDSDLNMFNVNQGGSLKFVKNAEGGNLIFDGNGIAKASMLYGRGELILDGITMKNGKAGNGGAIQLRTKDATLIVKNSCFENNLSTGNGGAISLVKENGTCPTAVIGNTTFKSNQTTVGDNQQRFGGAIYMEGGSIISNGAVNFENNKATIGGAIYMKAGTVTLSDGGEFKNNMAGVATKNMGRAGAVDVISGTFTVKGYDFTGNKAVKDGGAVRVESGSANIENCNFINNSAGTTAEVTGNGIYNGRGGAIYVTDTGTLNLTGTGEFSGNTYTHGDTGTVKNAIYKANGTVNNNGTYEFYEDSIQP